MSCGINPHSFHIHTFLLWAIQTVHTCSHTPECRPVLDAAQLFTSPEDDQLLKHSTLLRPPIQLHILMFSKERKGEKSKSSLGGGAISFFCVLESAIILWDGVFELCESEFLMTHSKAKSTVPKQSSAPQTEERGLRSKNPQRNYDESRNMAACKKPSVTQTLKFVTSVTSFTPKRHKQAGYLWGISGATCRFPHPSNRQSNTELAP